MITSLLTRVGALVRPGATLSTRQMVGRLAIVFSAGLGLDYTFWLLADFGSFVTPLDGPFAECVCFVALTASGPFAMAINGHFVNIAASHLVTCGLSMGLVAIGLIWRLSAVARLTSYTGVLLRFFIGFSVAGSRIR